MRYVLAVLLAACVFNGDQVYSQEEGSDAVDQLVQKLDQEIDQLRNQLMALESERSETTKTSGSHESVEVAVQSLGMGTSEVSQSDLLQLGDQNAGWQPVESGEILPQSYSSQAAVYQPPCGGACDVQTFANFAPRNNFFPPVLAAIYDGSPAYIPRRSCCLFRR